MLLLLLLMTLMTGQTFSSKNERKKNYSRFFLIEKIGNSSNAKCAISWSFKYLNHMQMRREKKKRRMVWVWNWVSTTRNWENWKIEFSIFQSVWKSMTNSIDQDFAVFSLLKKWWQSFEILTECEKLKNKSLKCL